MKSLRCLIDSISYFNHDTRRVTLKIPAGETVAFKPGQYLNLVLGEKRCPFSIASTPDQSGYLELHVRPTMGSDDSVLIEKLLDDATEVELEAPLGNCFLDQVPEMPLMLLAASTGITQMKSIIDYIQPRGFKSDCHLYWGVLSADDLYLQDYWLSLAQQEPRFHYTPVVSEPERSPDWQGKTGLVGDTALADFKDLSNVLVYVSGGPGMVYATLDRFVELGLPANRMRSDVFDYAPRG